jgi:MoaA/NifB/PqqE/SkfB family radical SAM enzyme
MKTRIFPESNYKSVFFEGKTLRMPLKEGSPLTELRYPEFIDISMGTYCSGNCPYCYASALKTGKHYTNLSEKIHKIFGTMSKNQRPYQVACGGEGESMENPECWDALKSFNDLGIVPNLTSNGMYVNETTIPLIQKYCGGIAITCHLHLRKHWERAIEMLVKAGMRINLHVIISNEKSIEFFKSLYQKYSHCIEYFVLLPYMNVGHAAKHKRDILLNEFEKSVDEYYNDGKLSFGANFYSFLQSRNHKYNLKLYQPEIFSKYLLLNDKLEWFNNSFDKKPVPFTVENGCELGYARSNFNFENMLDVNIDTHRVAV